MLILEIIDISLSSTVHLKYFIKGIQFSHIWSSLYCVNQCFEPVSSSHADFCNVSISCLNYTPVVFSMWYVLGSPVGLFKNMMFRSHLRPSKSVLGNEALNIDAEVLPSLSWFMLEVENQYPECLWQELICLLIGLTSTSMLACKNVVMIIS